MFGMKWHSLVSETQFAVHQSVQGISELAAAVHADQLFDAGRNDEVRHLLNNGLFAYTTGLERLAKLTLSAVHYRTHGDFPNVRKFGHRISDLLEGLRQVDSSQYSHDGYSMIYVRRGLPTSFTAGHLSLLDDYAQGSGRYEFLDSLSKSGLEPDLYTRWMGLCQLTQPTSMVTQMCGLPRAIASSLYTASRMLESAADLGTFDWLIEPYIDNCLNEYLYDVSVEVALIYYEVSRWVAAHLSAVSEQIFYHDPRPVSAYPLFPLLGEVTDPRLLLSRDMFVQLNILKLNDIDVTIEGICDVEAAFDSLDRRG